jgi:hypothetical protein
MAFSQKYIIQSTSDYFGKIDLIITANNYSGDVIELDAAGRDWIKLSIGGNSEDIGDVVLPSTLEFQFYVKDDFKTIEFGNSEPLSYRVEVRRADPLGVGFRIIWQGWINPELYSEDYQNTPYVAYVNASCGLEYLKNIKYSLVGVKKSLLEQIIHCLEKVQNNNNIFESINIYDTLMANGDNDSPLVQAKVNNSTYFDIGDDVSCYDVLTAILRPFFARIYLYEGWRIENIDGKKSSYVVRRYSYQGSGMIYTFLFSFIFDPLKELDNSPSGFKSFINKSGNLQFKPSINNTEIYFKTSQPDGNLILRGFSNDDDWLNNTTPKDWIRVNNIPTSKFEINLSNNQYAVRILGKNSSFENNQYIESKKLELNKANFQNLNIGFKYFMNYPAIILLGSKPILYVEVYLESSESSSIFYYNNGWSNLPKPMRIDATGRLFYFNWSVNIDTIPESGDLYIRIHRLVKKGDTGNTELRITEFTANLSVGEMPTNLVLKEIGSSGISTNYIGPSFEHYISDGQVVDRNGVLDVGNVLTSSWSRRGKTDNLNIRRLYILQWLSMLQKPTSVLSGTVLIKNEEINPLSVIKDKDSVRDTRYIMTSWNVSLSTGIGDVSYRELPLTDADVQYTVEQVTQDEIKDLYPDFTVRDGIGFNTGTGSGSTTNNTATTINVTPLNGDVSGEISTAILNPSAIVNKETIPLTGQLSSRIVLNAVEDSEDQENMTKTSVKDLFGSWTEKTTTVNNDKLVIIDSQDNGELKTVTKANLGIKEKFIDLIDTPSTYTGQQNKLPIVNSGQDALIFTNLKTINSESIIGDGGITIPTGIGGSGTTNFIPKFTPNGTTLGNSQIFDNGTNVGIGTTNPKLNPNAGKFLTIDGESFNGWLELASSAPTNGFGGAITFNNNNIVGADKRNAQIAGIRDGANNSGALLFTTWDNGTGTDKMRIASGGQVTINNLSGSGNGIVISDASGTLTRAIIGSGLNYNATTQTLTATGGSQGTVTTDGTGQSGIIPLWNSSTALGSSVLQQSTDNRILAVNPINGTARLAVVNTSTGTLANSFLYAITTGNRYLGFVVGGQNRAGTTAGLSNASLAELQAGGDSSAMLLNAGGNFPMVFAVNNAEAMRLNTSRNLLINTTSNLLAGGFLQVNGSVNSSDVNAYILSQQSNALNAKYWYLQNTSSGQFRIRAVNDEISGGINGIVISRSGITSVSLELGGNTNVNGNITSTGSINTTDYLLNNKSLLNHISVYTIISDFDGRNSLFLGGVSDPSNYYDNGNHFFRNRTGATVYASILFNGNFLINTTNDNGNRLQVNGNITSNGLRVTTGEGVFNHWVGTQSQYDALTKVSTTIYYIIP